MDLSAITWHPLGYLHTFKPFQEDKLCHYNLNHSGGSFEPFERGKAIMAITTRLLAIIQTIFPTLGEEISYSTDNQSSKIVITRFSSEAYKTCGYLVTMTSPDLMI